MVAGLESGLGPALLAQLRLLVQEESQAASGAAQGGRAGLGRAVGVVLGQVAHVGRGIGAALLPGPRTAHRRSSQAGGQRCRPSHYARKMCWSSFCDFIRW